MEILASLYYFFGILLLIPLSFLAYKNEPFTVDTSSRSEYEETIGVGCFFFLPYVMWVLIGITTSQWMLFVSMVVISSTFYFLRTNIFYIEPYKSWIRFLSRAVEIVIIAFICLNHFHFEIEITMQLVKSMF